MPTATARPEMPANTRRASNVLASYGVLTSNLILWILAGSAYVFIGGKWREQAGTMTWLLGYATVAHALVHAQARYNVPFVPYGLLLAAPGVNRLTLLGSCNGSRGRDMATAVSQAN